MPELPHTRKRRITQMLRQGKWPKSLYQAARDDCEDEFAERSMTIAEPTNARPGSQEKIDVMAKRIAANQHCFAPDDNTF